MFDTVSVEGTVEGSNFAFGDDALGFISKRPQEISADRELNLVSQSMKNEYLSRELEEELATSWLENGCVTSRNRLVSAHMRLAISVAKKHSRDGYEINDLMQDATLGLMRAAETYDPSTGYRFSTYARWWIRSFLQEAIMKGNSAVSLKCTTNNRSAFFALSKNESQAEVNLRRQGIEPTPETVHRETARMMNMSPERLTEIKQAVPQVSSLNEQVVVNFELKPEKIDLLLSDEKNPEEEVISKDLAVSTTNLIAEAMATLSDREKTIVRSRSMNLEPVTLEVLANRFDITRERIRQIEIQALGKIKERLKRMGIEDLSILIEND